MPVDTQTIELLEMPLNEFRPVRVMEWAGLWREEPRRRPRSPMRPVLALEEMLEKPLPRWKRLVDIAAAAAGLVLLGPLMLVVALAVKLTSRGPILFKQERTGFKMRRFKVFKFRTMVCDAVARLNQVRHLNEMSGPLIKIRRDPRLTAIGGILRRTSLDELPQLINVLRGEMTLIGPRALSPLPTQYAAWMRRRFWVMPGIACTWQAERRAERDFVAWMRSDLHYVKRTSFRFDLQLFIKVIFQVFRCQGS